MNAVFAVDKEKFSLTQQKQASMQCAKDSIIHIINNNSETKEETKKKIL